MRIIFLLFIFSFFSFQVGAYETDQFTLPPKALKDIGPDVSEYVYEKIVEVVEKFNWRYRWTFESMDQIYMPALAQDIYEAIGGGAKFTDQVEGWLGNGISAPPYLKNKYPDEFICYRQDIDDSIYSHATFHHGWGLGYKLLFSSTINLYGTSLGTDKLGHFFKQGHQYYDIYVSALLEGMSEKDAQKYAAYKRGVKTEDGYFGIGLSGVFSSADLFTNYTGMKFYQNLTKSIFINGQFYPPLLKLKNGSLVINEDFQNGPLELMKRFIHPHMNEAMNPSFYDSTMVETVSKNIKKVCPLWKKNFPNYNLEDEQLRLEYMKTWWGEDYGHILVSHPERKLVTIGNSCLI